MRRREALAILGLPLLLAGCGEPDRVVNCRLILEVETPEGLKTGSSVVEKIYHLNSTFERMSGADWNYQTRGEATAVDLGARGILFALLKGDEDRPRSGAGPGPGVFFHLYGAHPNENQAVLAALDAIKRDKPRIELPVSSAPLLVRFRDINDPKSVEKVDPLDLAKTFGAGVRLTRMFVEATDAPVTEEIAKRLGWLNGSFLGTGTLSEFAGPGNPSKLSKNLSTVEFQTGFRR